MFVRASLIALCFTVLSGWTACIRADALAPADTAGHIGETATVCGLVASTNYAPKFPGAPTFLDFGGAYPQAVFTALILGTERTKFREPETRLKGKLVCVTGQIRAYRGAAQVILTEPEQLREVGSAHAGP
jgi:hypothetical protein